jgi:hypothetical protein
MLHHLELQLFAFFFSEIFSQVFAQSKPDTLMLLPLPPE